MAFEQNKKLEDFILLLKEGIVEDEPVDETELDEEGSEGEEGNNQTEQNDSSDDESVSAKKALNRVSSWIIWSCLHKLKRQAEQFVSVTWSVTKKKP